jgi:hypothetical protein
VALTNLITLREKVPVLEAERAAQDLAGEITYMMIFPKLLYDPSVY